MRLHKDQCKRVCRELLNSPDGREYLYIALLSAMSSNKVSHFNWKLEMMVNILSRDEVELSPRQLIPISEDIDGSSKKRFAPFCHTLTFHTHDMSASLLQYAVMFGSRETVENLLPRVENVSSMCEWQCPFLPARFLSTALWLAAFQDQPSIRNLLLIAGCITLCNLLIKVFTADRQRI